LGSIEVDAVDYADMQKRWTQVVWRGPDCDPRLAR
jgi:hypothetical protein